MSLRTSYDEAFIRGVEDTVPKIASYFEENLGLPGEEALSLAENVVLQGFSSTKEANFAPYGAGHGSLMGVQDRMPTRSMRMPPSQGRYPQMGRGPGQMGMARPPMRRPQPHSQNNFAGKPPPSSVLSTAAGIGGTGAIGMGIYKDVQAQRASNSIFNQMRDQALKAMPAEQAALSGAGREAAATATSNMQDFLKAKNMQYADEVANAARAGGSTAKQMQAVEQAMLKNVGAGEASNVKNFLKHNLMKGKAFRWGLGGLGLLGLSQLM